MSQSGAQSPDEPKRNRYGRRGILALLASVGAVGLSDALAGDGPNDSGGLSFALGDSDDARVRNPWEFGRFSFAPKSVSAETSETDWWTHGNSFAGAAGGDDGARHEFLYDDTNLPLTKTINGIQLSLSTSLSTARGNVSQYPAIAGEVVNGSPDGYFEWVYDDTQTPYNFTSNGLTVVLDTDFTSAEATWDGSRPAIVYGLDGYGEVKH